MQWAEQMHTQHENKYLLYTQRNVMILTHIILVVSKQFRDHGSQARSMFGQEFTLVNRALFSHLLCQQLETRQVQSKCLLTLWDNRIYLPLWIPSFFSSSVKSGHLLMQRNSFKSPHFQSTILFLWNQYRQIFVLSSMKCSNVQENIKLYNHVVISVCYHMYCILLF